MTRAEPGARRLPAVDAVVVGLGWAGGIVASELARRPLKVVGLERGPDRADDDSVFTSSHDELRFRVRSDLMQDPALETWTLRHHRREAALPIRQLGAFRPGTGVGGSSLHYGGQTLRYLPVDFALKSHIFERYGSARIPAGASWAPRATTPRGKSLRTGRKHSSLKGCTDPGSEERVG